MDGRVIELLRDLATTFDLERSPLAEISDLGQQAVPCLIKALTHADPVIRKMAAFALGELRSPFGDSPDLSPAVPHLEQLLDTDADPHVRMQAAESLWYLTESKKAIHTFVNGLSESDLGIRRWAAAMLGLSGMQVEEAIQPLIHALDDDDLLLRRCVGRVSARFGADAAEALPKLEPLLDEDEFTRLIGANAILSIAPSRTEELGPMLIDGLRSRAWNIRRDAAEFLDGLPAAGKIGLEALIEALDDGHEGVRVTALQAITSLGSDAAPAVPAILTILRGDGRDGDDFSMRTKAASALAEIGPEAHEAAYFLWECIQEPGDDALTAGLRLRAAFALWMIQQEPDYLLEIGIKAMTSPSSGLRCQAAALLGHLGAAGQPALPHLRRALEDTDRFVQERAASSIQTIEAAA